MIKRTLLAIVLLSVCSTTCFAQDIYWSFGQGADVSPTGFADINDGTGSAFVFVRNGYRVDALDIDIANSDNNVIELTGAEIFNPELLVGDIPLGVRWFQSETQPQATVNADGTGRLFAVSVFENGIGSPDFSGFDPGFDPIADAFLLARLDYDIVGEGTTDLSFSLTFNGVVQFTPDFVQLDPVFGSGSLTVTSVPEPSSAGLLALGLAGIVAGRRR